MRDDPTSKRPARSAERRSLGSAERRSLGSDEKRSARSEDWIGGGRSTVVKVTCTPGQAELVADRLLQCGASAVAEESPAESTDCDGRYDGGGLGRAALTADVDTELLEGLRSWLTAMAPPGRIEELEVDPKWATAWREHATAVAAGPFLVRPPWVEHTLHGSSRADTSGAATPRDATAPVTSEEPAGMGSEMLDLVVDPRSTFGSGSHPSTQMCLRALGERAGDRQLCDVTGWTVADVGCGSGVLAVGALLLGADRAVGVDVDPAAAETSRSVASANGVGDRYEFREGGVAELCRGGETFDVVMANLLIPVIEELAVHLRALCAAGGSVVVSGLLARHRARALAALGVSGRSELPRLSAEHEQQGWLTLVLQC